MGIRVTFYLGAPDGLEGLFWEAGPQLFLDWARALEQEFRGTFSPDMLHRIDRAARQ